MDFKIGKKQWKMSFVRKMPAEPNLPVDRCGDTDWSKKAIRVKTGMDPKETLETIIHEMIHAYFPKVTEKRVTDAGYIITDVLWRLGYRTDK